LIAREEGVISKVTAVIATRDRRESLLRTLSQLAAVPEPVRVVVVDNGSVDRSAAAVRARHPGAQVIELADNQGAIARNIGVARSQTPYVAFVDDDSWWTAGSLRTAVTALEEHPGVGGIIGRVELHPAGVIDAVSRKLSLDLLGTPPGLPGPRALSFPAFAAVLRRDAFQQVGGFNPLLFFGGEEQLLATDLAMAGWPLCYLAQATTRHAPGNPVLSPARWAQQTRNDILVLWMRRPWMRAATATLRLAGRGLLDPAAAQAAAGLLQRLPSALRQRRPVLKALDRDLLTAERPEQPPAG
jgi:GT2 family glycosyltransferase